MQMRKLAVTAAIALALAGSTAALAQQKLKFAHVYETTEPYHQVAVWAAGEIAKRTSNRYTMEVFPASSLGSEVQLNQALTLGTVDVIYTGQLFAGRAYGPISIGGAPFVFRDFDHWQKFTKSKLFSDLSEGYSKGSGGNEVLALTYYGNRQTTSNKPLNKPEDMRGLKIRVPEAPLYTLFPKAVGANPTPIAFAEVYLALQNKTVDAQENPLPTIDAKKFYEVQTHINITAHITDGILTIVAGPTWSKLSDADRKTFRAIFQEASALASKQIVENEKRLMTEFTKRGTTVVMVDRKPFMAAVQKFYAEGKQPTGEALPWPKDIYDRLQAIK